MQYKLPVLAVKDVEISKKFYRELFEQEVAMDFGWNVTFSGGFAIQQNFAWLTDLPEEIIIQKSNNMELYFEVDDFEAFQQKILSYPDIEYVHPPKKHEWQQRVIRIYDPDYHIIEIGESMAHIAKRYLMDGYSVAETAEIIQYPIAFVEQCKQELLSNLNTT